ncbi:MAG: alkaline phosphatase PhoX [Gammaproteobacteria bacterium]
MASRREFLRRSAVVGAAAAGGAMFAGGPFQGLVTRQLLAAGGGRPTQAKKCEGGYGDLRPITRTDNATNDTLTLLLPEGFDFVHFGLAGTPMSDGHLTPLGHDAMAAFPGPDGTTRLVRNHEDRNIALLSTPPGSAAKRYDQRGGGGTSTLQVRTLPDGSRVLEKDFMSLSGTIVNCAGGPTPWGSWLTCEETTEGRVVGTRLENHGYVFEVPSMLDGEVDPIPLKEMGRMVHEAAAVDPRTGIVYLTEDRRSAGLYRFVPKQPGHLAQGGRLEMLAVSRQPQYDTGTGQQRSQPLPVEWVHVEDPDPSTAELDPGAVFKQGYSKGGARFARLEGCWWDGNSLYFCSTSGGDAGEGQIWEYRAAGSSGGQLVLLYESPGAEVMSFPDNVTVSPRGALVVCEDPLANDFHRLIGVTHDTRTFELCHTEQGVEWAGATFAPDGRTLFANLQGSTVGNPRLWGTFEPGRTVAIWGPWELGAL